MKKEFEQILNPFIKRFNEDNNFDVELFVLDDDENSLQNYDEILNVFFKIRTTPKLEKEFYTEVQNWLTSITNKKIHDLAENKIRCYFSIFDSELWHKYNKFNPKDMNYNNLDEDAFEYKCNNDIRQLKDKDYYNYYHDRLN